MGDAWDGCLSAPKKIIRKLDANWGRASAQQPKGVLVDSDGGNMLLSKCLDEVLEHCEECGAVEKVPHEPVAGTSAVSMFRGKLQVDLSFLGDPVALRATDVFPKNSILIPERSKNPQERRDAFCSLRIGISGLPRIIQMDEGG